MLHVNTPISGIHDATKQRHHAWKHFKGSGRNYSTASTADKQDPDINETKIQPPSPSELSTDAGKKICVHTDQDSPAVIAVSTVIRNVLSSSPASLKELISRIQPFYIKFQKENGHVPCAAELLTYIEVTAPEVTSPESTWDGKGNCSNVVGGKDTSEEHRHHVEHKKERMEDKYKSTQSLTLCQTTQPLTEDHHGISGETAPANIEQADASDSNEASGVQPISLMPEKKLKSLMLNAVRREHTYLKKSLTCVLCHERPAEVTLLPCGHFVLCAACSGPCLECPVCHARALAEVKTYLG